MHAVARRRRCVRAFVELDRKHVRRVQLHFQCVHGSSRRLVKALGKAVVNLRGLDSKQLLVSDLHMLCTVIQFFRATCQLQRVFG